MHRQTRRVGVFVYGPRQRFVWIGSLLAMLAGPVGLIRGDIQLLQVPNGSFELPASNDGLYRWTSVDGDSTTVPNWTFNRIGDGSGGGGGAQNSINAEFPATTGSPGILSDPADAIQYGWLNLTGSAEMTCMFTSVSLGPIQPWTRYRLTVAMGDRLNEEPAEAGIALLANDLTIPGTEAWVLGSQLPEGGFQDLSVMLDVLDPSDALVGQSLRVRLLHHRPALSGTVSQANFDNVRVRVGPVPEPSRLAGVGVVALVSLRGRRHGARRRQTCSSRPVAC